MRRDRRENQGAAVLRVAGRKLLISRSHRLKAAIAALVAPSTLLIFASLSRILDRMAEVLITSEAFEQAQDLPKPIRARIRQLVNRLADWPKVSGAKPLRGKLAGHYRLRTGD